MEAADAPTAASRRSSLARPPMIVIEGGRGRLRWSSIREVWAYREVLWAFLVRYVKVKYKQAAVGVGWAVLQPLLLAGVFAIFLGRYAHVPSEGAPFILFALAGLVPWTFFASAAAAGMESVVKDQGLLGKVYFPREVLPLGAAGAALVDLVPGIVLLLVFSVAFGIAPGITWLALPLPIVILIVSAGVLSLGFSGLNVYYRDVRHALPFVLQFLLFASPVVYPLGKVPGSIRTVYAIVNPVALAVDGIRRIVLHHRWPSALSFAALAWACVLLVLAYSLFKRLERGFADRV
ncbi:MAG: ABC transporter permease [Actinomycetota bacterium]